MENVYLWNAVDLLDYAVHLSQRLRRSAQARRHVDANVGRVQSIQRTSSRDDEGSLQYRAASWDSRTTEADDLSTVTQTDWASHVGRQTTKRHHGCGRSSGCELWAGGTSSA